MNRKFLVCIVFLVFQDVAFGDPIWKVFCSGSPIYRGRVDPIVNPGKVAGHSHKVSGGAHFSAAGATQTPLEVFNDMYSSPCTSCSIGEIDMSAYWHPDLYFTWPNGTFSVVPDGGLTVYYLSRSGSGDQAHPDWQPIPKGLRMLAGNPLRRNFSGSLEDRAVNYACLVDSGADYPSSEPNNFPTDKYFCKNGLRAQVFFPMCWDGVNLDSVDHKSHMAYPSNVNGGNCPGTHPVRIPGVFFEAFYSVSAFPHGNGTNPFVWSCGDPTGYGFHGDFLSGWNPNIMAKAIKDVKCDLNNTDMAFGNNVKACPPFAPYVKDGQPAGACPLSVDIPLNEDLGIGRAIEKLPGCNPITYGPAQATMCSQAPADYVKVPTSVRFLLKSHTTGMYVVAPTDNDFAMHANGTVASYYAVWAQIPQTYGVAIQNEGTGDYVSASGNTAAQLFANRGSYNSYEGFYIETVNGNISQVMIRSNRTNKYVTVKSGYLFPNATQAADIEIFDLEVPSGGSIGVVGDDVPVFPPTNTTGGYVPPATTGSATGAVDGNNENYDSGAQKTVIALFILAICSMLLL
jgi:hypothetical protein